MQFSFQRLGALIRKETIQLLRDRRYIGLTLALAVIQLLLYAYAANQTAYHLPLVVLDQSQDARSRSLVQALVNSQFFDVALRVQSQDEVLRAIEQGLNKIHMINGRTPHSLLLEV